MFNINIYTLIYIYILYIHIITLLYIYISKSCRTNHIHAFYLTKSLHGFLFLLNIFKSF